MEKVAFTLIFAWVVTSSTTSILYWATEDLTPSKFKEAVNLCGDRELKHIDLGLQYHTVRCMDGGEYNLSTMNKRRDNL